MNKKQITGICIAVLLIAIYLGVKIYASNIAEENVNKAIDRAANVADINYKKVSVDLPGMDVRISDIFISSVNTTEKIKIDEIIIHDIDGKSDIPAFLSISCNGVELNIKDFVEEAKGLKALGYNDKIMLNLNADYAYDKEKKELDIKKIGLKADEAGEISVSFRLGNINPGINEIAALFFTFPQIIFHEAKIKYEDNSLTERLMTLESQKKQTNLKDFKQSLIQKVEKEIEKEKDDLVKKALIQIKNFLENPEKLSISASPSKPYSLGDILRVDDPRNLIGLLNIQIKS